jgi:hypothetical protein
MPEQAPLPLSYRGPFIPLLKHFVCAAYPALLFVIILAAFGGSASANLVFGPPVGRPIVCTACTSPTPSSYSAAGSISDQTFGPDETIYTLNDLDVGCGGGNEDCGAEGFYINDPLAVPLPAAQYNLFLDATVYAPLGTQGTFYACVFETALATEPACTLMTAGDGQITAAANFTGAGSTYSLATAFLDVNGPIYGIGFELDLPGGLPVGDSILGLDFPNCCNLDGGQTITLGRVTPEPSSLLLSSVLIALLLAPVAIRRKRGGRPPLSSL